MTEPIPYTTKDFAEAVTLATCGVPFFYPDKRMMLVYDAEKLRQLGMTAREAQEKGIEGNKAWVFVMNENCRGVSAVFHEVWKAAKNEDRVLPEFDISQIALVASTALKNRRELAGDWKHVPPQVAISRGEGKVTIISDGTPKEALERWGLL